MQKNIKFLMWDFGIHLTFACLREAALACQRTCSASKSAKARILKFGFIKLTLFLHEPNFILS